MDPIFKTLLDAGGTVSVAVIFLFYMDRQERRNNTLIGNHLSHSTDAMEKMSNALTELSILLRKITR